VPVRERVRFSAGHPTKVRISQDGLTVTKQHVWVFAYMRGAKCGHPADVMTQGRHYAEFTFVKGTRSSCGVTDPAMDMASWGGAVESNYNRMWLYYCQLGTNGERMVPGCSAGGSQEWPGHEGPATGDRIGLLLDLTEGSLTVFKNDRRLGKMVEAGITAPVCWVALPESTDDAISIDNRMPVPV
jgi:hypothetical protein